MKTIKNKAISVFKTEENKKSQTGLRDLFISTRKCWSNMIVFNLKNIYLETLTMEDEKNDEKRKNREIFFYAFISCLHFVACYKSKLLETREKSHKVEINLLEQ